MVSTAAAYRNPGESTSAKKTPVVQATILTPSLTWFDICRRLAGIAIADFIDLAALALVLALLCMVPA
jgi:hypothetical protein